MILSSTGFLSRIGVLLTLGGLLLLNSAYHVSYVYAFLALGAFLAKVLLSWNDVWSCVSSALLLTGPVEPYPPPIFAFFSQAPVLRLHHFRPYSPPYPPQICGIA